MDPAPHDQSIRTAEHGTYVLARNLVFDPHACVLLHRRTPIILTARECAVLSMLVHTPHCYVSTHVLSHHLSKPGTYPIDEHSIQQTICDLRRKLREDAANPRLLLTKRGLGYGIFPRRQNTNAR